MFSKDGVTWTNAHTESGPFPAGSAFIRVAYGNGVWIAIDTTGAIGISSNGVDWLFRQQFKFDSDGFEDIDFGNDRFIIGAAGGIYSSVAPTLSLIHSPQRRALDMAIPASPYPAQVLSSEDLIEWSAFATFPLGTLGGSVSISTNFPRKHFKFRAGD